MKQTKSRTPLQQVRKRNSVSIRTGGRFSLRSLTPEENRVLRSLLTKPVDFIDSPVFHEADAERKIYENVEDVPKPDTAWYQPLMDDPGSARNSRQNRESVLLSGKQEVILFHQFNYARFRVRSIQNELGMEEGGPAKKEPTPEQVRDLLKWKKKADSIREQIAETNLALVLAMAKRTRMSEVDFADLISEGNMALMRAVDKFDAGRGFKFSTYACRAILKAFSRQGMKLSRYRQRFPTDFDTSMEKSDALEVRRQDLETDAAGRIGEIVRSNHCGMSEIEKTVIEHRFGIDRESEETGLTLEQVGQIIGVTKERVRQIQNKALEKIRIDLEENFLSRVPSEKEDKTSLTVSKN